MLLEVDVSLAYLPVPFGGMPCGASMKLRGHASTSDLVIGLRPP